MLWYIYTTFVHALKIIFGVYAFTYFSNIISLLPFQKSTIASLLESYKSAQDKITIIMHRLMTVSYSDNRLRSEDVRMIPQRARELLRDISHN